MSKDTWNFPTFQCRDGGPGGGRSSAGQGILSATTGFYANPLPFSDSITGIFSFFIDSTYTADGGEPQFINSIGVYASFTAWMSVYLVHNSAGNSVLDMWFYDGDAAATRYLYNFGDDDGVSWLQADKWYQVAFSANSGNLVCRINGQTPTTNVITNVPGPLNLGLGDEQWSCLAPSAAYGQGWPVIGEYWPSFIAGPAAYEASYLDLTSQANLDRIFDADGNFKNPGQNGSWWFNDSYTTSSFFKPDVYFPDGGGRLENGSFPITFYTVGDDLPPRPGGLRKFYE